MVSPATRPTQQKQTPDRADASARLGDRMVWILDYLHRVAVGQDIASNISEAAYRLQSATLGTGTLAEADLQELLHALRRAETAACKMLPPDFDRAKISIGFDALATQAAYLAVRGDDRCGHLSDARSIARIFRNEMHNLSLAQELDERRARRRHALKIVAPSAPSQLVEHEAEPCP